MAKEARIIEEATKIEEDKVDLNRVTAYIPKYMRVAIADVVLSFSQLEASLEEYIWAYVNINPEHGQLITGSDFRRKAEIVKNLSAINKDEKEFKRVTGDVWKHVAACSDVRNACAHGMLMMIDHTDLGSISYRGKAPGNLLACKVIPLSSLRQSSQIALALTGMFRATGDGYRALHKAREQ